MTGYVQLSKGFVAARMSLGHESLQSRSVQYVDTQAGCMSDPDCHSIALVYSFTLLGPVRAFNTILKALVSSCEIC